MLSIKQQEQILALKRQNPMLTQSEISEHVHASRSAVGVVLRRGQVKVFGPRSGGKRRHRRKGPCDLCGQPTDRYRCVECAARVALYRKPADPDIVSPDGDGLALELEGEDLDRYQAIRFWHSRNADEPYPTS